MVICAKKKKKMLQIDYPWKFTLLFRDYLVRIRGGERKKGRKEERNRV